MNLAEIVHGTCDGTDAAIYVCVGFIPNYVKVWNMEDAGNLEPVIEWNRQMALITQMDEGIKTIGITQAAMSREVIAANGIAAYAGGDEIVYDDDDGNGWVDNLTDLTAKAEVYVDGHYQRTATTDAAYKCIGDSLVGDNPRHGAKVKTPPGFVIGADGDINVNGEQLSWMAMR